MHETCRGDLGDGGPIHEFGWTLLGDLGRSSSTTIWLWRVCTGGGRWGWYIIPSSSSSTSSLTLVLVSSTSFSLVGVLIIPFRCLLYVLVNKKQLSIHSFQIITTRLFHKTTETFLYNSCKLQFEIQQWHWNVENNTQNEHAIYNKNVTIIK